MDKEARIREAQACADRCVARRRMCAGCYDQFYCEIDRKFREAYPNNLLDQIVMLIVTNGASAYKKY